MELRHGTYEFDYQQWINRCFKMKLAEWSRSFLLPVCDYHTHWTFFVCLCKSVTLISVARFYQFIDFNARHTHAHIRVTAEFTHTSAPMQWTTRRSLNFTFMPFNNTVHTWFSSKKRSFFGFDTWKIARFNWLAHTSSGLFFSDFFANFSTLNKFPCKLKKKVSTRNHNLTRNSHER